MLIYSSDTHTFLLSDEDSPVLNEDGLLLSSHKQPPAGPYHAPVSVHQVVPSTGLAQRSPDGADNEPVIIRSVSDLQQVPYIFLQLKKICSYKNVF